MLKQLKLNLNHYIINIYLLNVLLLYDLIAIIRGLLLLDVSWNLGGSILRIGCRI